jgi:hypothetical protein
MNEKKAESLPGAGCFQQLLSMLLKGEYVEE